MRTPIKPKDLHQEIIGLCGRFPEAPGNLHVTLTREQPFSAYTRYRVTYHSSPDQQVPGFLTVPAGQGPFPAVICIHQHNGQYHLGKSEPMGLAGNPDMSYAADLAERGYVTLTIDLDGFEERGSKRLTPSGLQYERFIATKRLLAGSTLQARYLWDLGKGLDVLAGLEWVDPDRIGAIGHSLGGQEVVYLMLYDKRVRAGVCSCGVGLWNTILAAGINHNMAAYVPELLSLGDMDTIIASLWPQALFMSAGTDDRIFPIDGVRSIFSSAHAAYDEAGCGDRFEGVAFSGGHGFPLDVRELAYDWLDRQLS